MICSICNKKKTKKAFYESELTRNKVRCIVCLKERNRKEYVNNKQRTRAKNERRHRTARCFLQDMHTRLVRRESLHRRRQVFNTHNKTVVELEEFVAWSLGHAMFCELFNGWIRSSYARSMTPTITRIDLRDGFFLTNLEFVTKKDRLFYNTH